MFRCCGLHTVKKLHSHCRDQKCQDKQYKKIHLGRVLKANAFRGTSHSKGIMLEKKRLMKNKKKKKKKSTAFVPKDGCFDFIEGHAVGDIPGAGFKIVKVANVSLLALYKAKKERP
ncbi:unnamed protein product [Nyctereutes procyonoides]|uniref:Small ribosomal subunit protein uS12 n=1 Tax=Nyctereutes procyonoides TaxID=34880 RepID=A0A811ZXL7_NYCPR|nr:unnamed protein product [Nyctereutes procyonoides]